MKLNFLSKTLGLNLVACISEFALLSCLLFRSVITLDKYSLTIFSWLLNWIRFSWMLIKFLRLEKLLGDTTHRKTWYRMMNYQVPYILFCIDIFAQCQCCHFKHDSQLMLYPCYMMLCMWHKDLHPREINPFLFISHWTTRTSYGLVTLSCVRSLLRALFMAICHLLKGKWTKINQSNNQFIFAGTIHTNATVATTAGLTGQLSNVH